MSLPFSGSHQPRIGPSSIYILCAPLWGVPRTWNTGPGATCCSMELQCSLVTEAICFLQIIFPKTKALLYKYIYILWQSKMICVLGPHTNLDSQAAYAGIWPRVGPWGNALDAERARKGGRPMRYCFSMCEVRGDWKWHRDLWFMKRHYQCRDICFKCFATTAPGPNQYLAL